MISIACGAFFRRPGDGRSRRATAMSAALAARTGTRRREAATAPAPISEHLDGAAMRPGFAKLIIIIARLPIFRKRLFSAEGGEGVAQFGRAAAEIRRSRGPSSGRAARVHLLLQAGEGKAPQRPLSRLRYDIHTSLSVGGHIGPSPSSRFAAPPLRYGRYAMTAPFRCGGFVSMIFAERSRPAQQRSWKPRA